MCKVSPCKGEDLNLSPQWFAQFPMITAGPKDRAGFMLAPV